MLDRNSNSKVMFSQNTLRQVNKSKRINSMLNFCKSLSIKKTMQKSRNKWRAWGLRNKWKTKDFRSLASKKTIRLSKPRSLSRSMRRTFKFLSSCIHLRKRSKIFVLSVSTSRWMPPWSLADTDFAESALKIYQKSSALPVAPTINKFWTYIDLMS